MFPRLGRVSTTEEDSLPVRDLELTRLRIGTSIEEGSLSVLSLGASLQVEDLDLARPVYKQLQTWVFRQCGILSLHA